MAANADSVVVDLVANVGDFNKNVTDASKNFDQSMSSIEQSAGKAEKAHSRLTLATNNSRIAMLEMGHVVRGSVDQFAAGAPLTQIFAQHIASIGEAANLAGGSLGKFGEIMSGGWGLAITAGIALLTTIISKHLQEGESVESLVAKLKEHAEKTHLSEEADRIWSATIEGLIEKQEQLNKTLADRLQVQSLVDESDLAREKRDLADKQSELTNERTRLANLQKQLAAQPGGSVGIGQGAATTGVDAANISKQIDASKAKIEELNTAIQKLNAGITQSSIVVGQTEGKALADLSAAASLFGEKYEGVLTQIIKDNPKLADSATKIEVAGQALISAATDAASAGVPFTNVTNRVSGFDKQLDSGKITVSTYATEIAKLTKQLVDMTEAAKEAAKHKIDPIEQFKQRLVGVEGTGANRAGSPAYGIGQFFPGTFEHYYQQAYHSPVPAGELDKFRADPKIAGGVIDEATRDYANKLKAAGEQVTVTSLYAVHLLNAGASHITDALHLLRAPANQPTSAFLGANVIAQNKNLLQGTAGEVRARIAAKFGDSSSAISAGVAAIANAAEQEKQREAAYGQKVDEAEGQLLAARKELGLSAEETAKIEAAAADAAAKRYQDDINANIIDAQGRGKYTKEEAANLIKLSDARTGLIKEIIARRLQEAQFARQEAAQQNVLTAETGQLQAHQDLLHSEEQVAKTARQRKAIEDRLIDLQYDELQLQLQSIVRKADELKAQAEITKSKEAIAAAEKAEAEAAGARAKLNNLPQERANAHQANAQQNASPLQSFFQSIPKTADEINNALEQIAVNGLNNFNNSLTDAIVNFRSLGDVGRAVLQGLEADMIQLALRLIEQHTIGALLGSATVGTNVAQAAAVGAAWAGPAALASLATLGANAGPAGAAIGTTVGLAFALGMPKAAGGRIMGFGTDTSDNILTPTSPDEFVIKAKSARSLGYDALEYINRTGELPGFADGGVIRPLNVRAASPGRSGGLSPDDLNQFRGMLNDAIRAMPDIKLYPTIDSGDVLSRGIGTTQGSRAVLAHVTDNSTKYRSVMGRPGS